MNISFKKDINRSYMVIEKVKEFSVNDFMMKMLSGNRIPGLLPIGYENLNGQYNLLYDISSKQAFSKIFEIRKISFRQLKAFLFSLKGLLRSLEEYLLDPNNIMLKQECIFANSEGEKYEYCYFPYYNGDLLLEMRELFTRMLSMVDYEDEKAVRLVYELHSEVQNENVTMDNLLEAYRRVLRESEDSERIQNDRSQEIPDLTEVKTSYVERQPLAVSSINETYSQEFAPDVENEWLKKHTSQEDSALDGEGSSFFERFRNYVKGRNFLEVLEDINNGEIREKIRQCGTVPEVEPPFYPSDCLPLKIPQSSKRTIEGPLQPSLSNTTRNTQSVLKSPELEIIDLPDGFLPDAFAEENRYLAASGEGTVLLNRSGKENHKLVGRHSQQGTRFVITGYPYTIGKNEGKSCAYLSEPTVSRMHARIYCEKNHFYIEDLNSTNGTFLNEDRLSAYTKTRINPGDILRFAGEEFCFQ